MVEGEGGRAISSLKAEGSRNLITGTYRAEQISSVSYDLVSSGAAQSRTHIGRAGAISPSPGGSCPASPRDLIKRGQKKASNKFMKCTQLPALENIDTLFKERESQTADDTSDDGLDSARLGKILEAPEGETDWSGTDQEFKERLKLPRVAEKTKEASTTSTWHLLLSHKTFHTHSDQHVVSCLVQVLGLDANTALHKTWELRKQRLLVLEDFNDKGEAFRKLQKLRSLGLQVQVTMNSGLPGAGRLLKRRGRRQTKQSPSALMRSYTELFFRAGAQGGTEERKVSAGRWDQSFSGTQLSRKRAGLAQWRSVQSGDFEQDVLPEDPVEALFLAERKRDRACQPSSLFKGLLTKHQSELQIGLLHPTQNSAVDGHSPFRPKSPRIVDAIVSAMKATDHHHHHHHRHHTENKESESPQRHRIDSEAAAETAASPHSLPEGLKSKEATPARKEACLLMRFFIFGYFENDEHDHDREALFRENIGSREQVKVLHRLWGRLDNDNSGRVDFSEFRAFAEQHVREMVKVQGQPAELMSPKANAGKNDLKPRETKRTLANTSTMLQMQTVNALIAQATEDTSNFCAALCEKLSTALLGKKSSFTIEDMMRLIWLFATQTETRTMKNWCRDFFEEAMRNRMDTPPVLDSVEYAGLCSVFEHFDEHRQGEILFETLVTKGLIYTEQVEEYRILWDEDGNGVLSLDEFCDMMCPVGFRATHKSERGSQPDGRRTCYDPCVGGWKLECLPDSFNEMRGDSKEQPSDDLLM